MLHAGLGSDLPGSVLDGGIRQLKAHGIHSDNLGLGVIT